MRIIAAGCLAFVVVSLLAITQVKGVLDGQAMPPALFSRRAACDLLMLDGDTGARGLLRNAILVPGDAAMLADIDRPSDLPR